MAAQWCIEGLQVAADAVFKTNATPEDKEIFLFSNNATITDATTGVDLTEITTAGGEKQTLTKGTWDAATAADPVVSQYNGSSGVSFAITGALTMYGYAVRGATSGKIYFAENFGLKTYANGQTLEIKPLQAKFDIPE
jgi:hypothetical protein